MLKFVFICVGLSLLVNNQVWLTLKKASHFTCLNFNQFNATFSQEMSISTD